MNLKRMNFKLLPILLALTYSFIIGLSFLFTKLVVPYAPPLLVLAHRFSFAVIFYALFLLIIRHPFNINRKLILKVLPILAFYPVLFFLLQILGLLRSSSSEAGIIFAVAPVLIVIISALLGNYPNKYQVIGVILSVGGVVGMFIAGGVSLHSGSGLGLFLLFLSTLSSALYTIMIKRLVAVYDVHDLTFSIVLAGFIAFNSAYFIQCAISGETPSYVAPLLIPQYLFGVAYLGILSSVVSSFLSNYILKSMSPPQFSVFSNLATLISVGAGALLLGETLHIHHYVGGLFILTGVIITNFSRGSR